MPRPAASPGACSRRGWARARRVGLFFTYGQDWVVAWLAASRIGALVMPLATTYRPAEIRTVLRIGDIDTLAHRAFGARTRHARDARSQRPRSRPRHPTRTSSFRRRRICAASGSPGPPTDPGRRRSISTARAAPTSARSPTTCCAAIEAEVVPGDLAQVTYTSGSSADPKGVVHTHGTVVRATRVLATLPTSGAGPNRYFCVFPFFWIGGTLVLGGALQSGATVLCTERFEPGAALDLIESERGDARARLADAPAVDARPPVASRSVTSPTSAGSPSAPPTSRWSRARFPGIPAHRGMSETVGNIASVEHRVVDHATGEDVADGEEGELLVRGYGLMHGYYKQERAEVFDDDGWLHTGDRVFLHGGRPYFVGRFTEMVKSRGANVAPREVELFLEEHFDEVLYAFVLGMPHPELGEEVTAVLVAAQGRTIDPDELTARARRQISGYKVPTRIEIWDDADVPWLGSGKPDKLEIRRRLERVSRR